MEIGQSSTGANLTGANLVVDEEMEEGSNECNLEVLEVNGKRYQHRTAGIYFNREEAEYILGSQKCPLVISAFLGNFVIKQLQMDVGIFHNILFYKTMKESGFPGSNVQMGPSLPLVLGGLTVIPFGKINLEVKMGEDQHQIVKYLDFIIVDSPSPNQAIIGQVSIDIIRAVLPSRIKRAKLNISGGRSQKNASRNHQILSNEGGAQMIPTPEDRRSNLLRPSPMEELVDFVINDQGGVVRLGVGLDAEKRSSLEKLLVEFKELFAWTASDMPGIDPDIISHRLNADPKMLPVVQRKRPLGGDRKVAVKEECKKLLMANFIRPIRFQTWVANPVMVKKSNGTWRMCIDFKDLNKACPRDAYPLPRIDQLVDATAGHELLSFMDAYSGYNQILMHPDDEEHTAFFADEDIFCYRVMPFGLRNAGATYQRMVNSLFAPLIGKTMEAYVDDMIVKTALGADHALDLRGCFEIMRKFKVRLNPKKCAFGVQSGKFLGFMVTHRGIEANPEKVKAIEIMQSPKSAKDIQRLTGRLASLSRFLSKSADKSLPFFKVLKGKKDFQWTDECETAFKSLKEYLSRLPCLAKPIPGEPLWLYLGVSQEAVSSVLVRAEGQVEYPIYFVSKVLLPAEVRYQKMEKLALALVVSARKMRPYFHAHEVIVLTDQPLGPVMSRPDISGRLVKWAVELSEFSIRYEPRRAIKGQALADFIVEVTAEVEGDLPEQTAVGDKSETDRWILLTDGSSTSNGAGAGCIIIPPGDVQPLKYSLALTFKATNNEAEYEAVVTGLMIAKGAGAEKLTVLTDSQLVVQQVNGEFDVKSERLGTYVRRVQELLASFQDAKVELISREDNHEADCLSRFASSLSNEVAFSELVEERKFSTIFTPFEIFTVQAVDTWMTPMVRYLRDGLLPTEDSERRKIKRWSLRYMLKDGVLYRRGYMTPLQRCVAESEVGPLLKEVHEGVAGAHEGYESLVRKISRLGYFWPALRKDAMEFVKRCEACQLYANIPRQPAASQIPLQSSWPFDQWGMDIIGRLPPTSRQRKFIIVAVDYFTKWVEAEAVTNVTETAVRGFLEKNILTRFGVPKVLVTDNGGQFASRHFREFCKGYGIQQRFASVAHPPTNGQVEVSNRVIMHGVKTKLESIGRSWADELPGVLWSFRTTPRDATGETPFSLVYGSEAVLPVELQVQTHRVLQFDKELNSERRLMELEGIEEKRHRAQKRSRLFKEASLKYFNRRVRGRQFRVGELVLRRNEFADRASLNKLSSTWEGPYKVIAIPNLNSYVLEDAEGRKLPRTFNVEHLKKYYY